MARVEGSELLAVPRAHLWRLLNDPDVLGGSIPGCRGFERDGDSRHRFRTAITVAAGAVTGVYEGTVEYVDVEEPERCTIVVSGRGDKGTIEGRGEISMEARDEGTNVGYRGDFKLTGPVAGVGQRLAPVISRKMIVETLRNLERRGMDTEEPDEPALQPAEARAQPTEPRADTTEPRARATEPRAQPAAPPRPAEAATEAFRPFSLPPAGAFAAGCAVGLLVGVAIGREL